jgi:hypothetical protein
MCRPTAVAMFEVRGDGLVTGRRKSSNGMSRRGVPWTSSLEVAFEAGVDAAAGRGDSVGVLLDRGPVEDVDACDVGGAAVGSDALGDRVEGRFGAAGEIHVGALAGVSRGDRGSDRSGGAVNDLRSSGRAACVLRLWSEGRSAVRVVGSRGGQWARCRSASLRARMVTADLAEVLDAPVAAARCVWNLSLSSGGSAPSR